MKRLEKYETCDGVLHDTLEDARNYAENKLYGAMLTSLACQLCQMTKYRETVDYIDSHLADFETLIKFKQDTILEEDEG